MLSRTVAGREELQGQLDSIKREVNKNKAAVRVQQSTRSNSLSAVRRGGGVTGGNYDKGRGE